MTNPKVFLVSCGKAKPLANALKEAIQKENVAKVEPWYTDEHFVPGKSTQQALVAACRDFDVALVLLTEDDLLKKGRSAERAPRDNCIYEAGLFTGALGLEPERCLFVSFVEPKALPTDLDGIGYIKMPKPTRGVPLDEKWLTENCCAQVDKIVKSIRQLGLCHKRPLLKYFTKDQLLDREQPKGREGGRLTAGEAVVVNSAEPVEQKDMRFACTVMDNIYSDVEYQYFFHAQTTWATRFVLLFRTLVVAGAILKSKRWKPEDVNSDDTVLACLKACKPEAENAIERLRKQLKIYLLPTDRVPIQCCIHNAQSRADARCYLRYRDVTGTDFFVEWCRGRDATDVANDLLSLRSGEEPKVVFCSTRDFDLYAAGSGDPAKLRRSLVREVARLFPAELVDKVNAACFSEAA